MPIAEVGGIHRLSGPDQLAAAAGLALILKQSGEVRYPTRARKGDEALLICLARRRADVLHAVPGTREPYRADFRQAA